MSRDLFLTLFGFALVIAGFLNNNIFAVVVGLLIVALGK